MTADGPTCDEVRAADEADRQGERDARGRKSKARTLEERADFFDHAREFTPLLAVETSDVLFLIRSDDPHIGRSLFARKDRTELRVLKRGMALLERIGEAERARAGTFIDVGANIGTSTVAALRANGFPRAVALEPEPRNLRMLRINLAVNELGDQVQVLPVGVADAPGRARLRVRRKGSGKERLLEIELLTLDSLVDRSVLEANGTGLLWIDAEGHEGHVLAGAGRLLAEGIPLILEIGRTLDEQGGIDLLLGATNEHYTHFIDMRERGTVAGSATLGYEIRPVSGLRDLIGNYLEPSASHTEVLFLRDPQVGGRGLFSLGLGRWLRRAPRITPRP